MKIFITLFLISTQSFAWDSAKCSKMLNDGLFKKYEWGGVGDYNLNAITKETKKSGSLTASGYTTTEGTTAVSDPKYSSNVSTSETQLTSSWGECSLFALKERKQQRSLYIAQNYDQIKKDVALGRGEHLEALSWFSLCENQSGAEFNLTLQKNFENLFVNKDKADLAQGIDESLTAEAHLKKSCFILSSL